MIYDSKTDYEEGINNSYAYFSDKKDNTLLSNIFLQKNNSYTQIETFEDFTLLRSLTDYTILNNHNLIINLTNIDSKSTNLTDLEKILKKYNWIIFAKPCPCGNLNNKDFSCTCSSRDYSNYKNLLNYINLTFKPIVINSTSGNNLQINKKYLCKRIKFDSKETKENKIRMLLCEHNQKELSEIIKQILPLKI